MDNVEKKRSLRLQFYDWIYESYDISFLPKYVFVNFDLVFKGKYKNLKKPIPIEDLWDMWRKKLPDLKKMHESQRRKGNEKREKQKEAAIALVNELYKIEATDDECEAILIGRYITEKIIKEKLI